MTSSPDSEPARTADPSPGRAGPTSTERFEYRLLLRKASASFELFEQHLNDVAAEGWHINGTIVRKNRWTWTEEVEFVLERAVR